MSHDRAAHTAEDHDGDRIMETIRYGLSGALVAVAIAGTLIQLSGGREHGTALDIGVAVVGFVVIVALRVTRRI